MKKQLAITALASALVLGGGGFAYYSYAAEVDQKTDVPTVESFENISQNEESLDSSQTGGDGTLETKPETTVGPGVMDPDTVDITEVPVADIHIPLSGDKVSLQSTELSQEYVQAMQKEYGLHIRSIYKSADGDEIRVSQTDATKDVSSVIESLKEDYSLETVEMTEINGLTALYVDGEVRKVVHLISNDHLFAISSNTATIDELLDFAKQIHE